MKNVLSLLIFCTLLLSGCNASEQKDEPSAELVNDTKAMEQTTIELEKSSQNLEVQIESTEATVDSLLTDI